MTRYSTDHEEGKAYPVGKVGQPKVIPRVPRREPEPEHRPRTSQVKPQVWSYAQKVLPEVGKPLTVTVIRPHRKTGEPLDERHNAVLTDQHEFCDTDTGAILKAFRWRYADRGT